MNLTDTIMCECCQSDKKIQDLIKVTGFGIFCIRCIDTEIYKLTEEERAARISLWDDIAYVNKKAMLRKYGILPEQYDSMYANQNGKCAICKTHQLDLKKPLCVDHCHASGKIRGLLCNHCNSLLGFSRDNIETLGNAILYLKSPKNTP